MLRRGPGFRLRLHPGYGLRPCSPDGVKPNPGQGLKVLSVVIAAPRGLAAPGHPAVSPIPALFRLARCSDGSMNRASQRLAGRVRGGPGCSGCSPCADGGHRYPGSYVPSSAVARPRPHFGGCARWCYTHSDKATDETGLECPPPPGVVTVTRRQSPDRVQVFRQDHDGLGRERGFADSLAVSRAQFVDLPGKEVGTAIPERDRKEV